MQAFLDQGLSTGWFELVRSEERARRLLLWARVHPFVWFLIFTALSGAGLALATEGRESSALAAGIAVAGLVNAGLFTAAQPRLRTRERALHRLLGKVREQLGAERDWRKQGEPPRPALDSFDDGVRSDAAWRARHRLK